MTPRTLRFIESLNDSGMSADASIAEHLETVASNGGEQDTESAMREELLQIKACATAGLRALGKFKLKGGAR